MNSTAAHTVLLEHCLDAAEGILADCRAGADASDATAGTSLLHGCGPPVIDLLARQAVSVLRELSSPPITTIREASKASKAAALAARRLDDLVELAHARFYAHIPSEVPVCWRQLYTDASILQFALAYDEMSGDGLDDGSIGSLVRPLDMALILAGGAGPPSRGRAWIHASLELLQGILDSRQYAQSDDAGCHSANGSLHPAKRPRLMSSRPRRDFSAGALFNEQDTSAEPSYFAPPVQHPVPRSGPLGLEGFQAYLDAARPGKTTTTTTASGQNQNGPQPLVIAGLTDNWPARRADARPWASPEYLRWRTLGGQRLVPVEVGRSYVDDGWRQEIVKFDSVLCALEADDVSPHARAQATREKNTMYLAQHSLFTQIPQLRDDICIPDACYSVTKDDDDDENDGNFPEPMLNAWLGPGGTITPLHTDAHHNLLAQVVGRKYVRLYSPEQSDGLRPRGREGGVEMGNTSTVDVGVMERWDDEASSPDAENAVERERFLALPYMDCILEPGDTLYIPRGWWHYVRGLNVSFSVSFWWD